MHVWHPWNHSAMRGPDRERGAERTRRDAPRLAGRAVRWPVPVPSWVPCACVVERALGSSFVLNSWLQKQNTKESITISRGHRLSPRGLGRPSGGGSLGPRAEEGGRQVEVWLSARQRNPCATDTPHNAAHRRAHADKKRNKPPTPYKQKITTQTGVLRIALTVAGRTEHSWSCFALAPLPSPGLQIIEEVVSVSV